MKASPVKSDTKKRKRDESKETVSESPKKAKVHAQRKFAQGAAFNSSVITPIKDKVRPAASAPNSDGPMITSKCPNTEDFLTFLCFRRTSILPPKLDFFKQAVGSESESLAVSNHKNVPEKTGGSPTNKNQKSKKNEKKTKSQPAAVQALLKKYQEQRIAKQKVTNVTKLAKKVKGKNMVRTRSAVVTVEEPKSIPKKRNTSKETKTAVSGLRSGLTRTQNAVTSKTSKPPTKVVKMKNLRAGLRSGKSSGKRKAESPPPKVTTAKAKKTEKDTKKTSTEVPQGQVKNVKPRKAEGFSDFSSDDNEPLLAVKKPKSPPKKLAKTEPEPVEKKGKKPVMKTRSQIVENESSKAVARPMRRTKEAAALYMEMISKKLVSPEKSGDDDVSSVDSFPELPNAKRNEQRESEIKAKALANKKSEQKTSGDKEKDKGKEVQKAATKKVENSANSGNKKKPVKDEVKNVKKESPVSKKDAKSNVKAAESSAPAKRANRSSTKDEGPKGKSTDKSDTDVKDAATAPAHRPSTRSRPQETVEVKESKSSPMKKAVGKSAKSGDDGKRQSAASTVAAATTTTTTTGSSAGEKNAKKSGTVKGGKATRKSETTENEKRSSSKTSVKEKEKEPEKKKVSEKETNSKSKNSGKDSSSGGVDEIPKEETPKKEKKSAAKSEDKSDDKESKKSSSSSKKTENKSKSEIPAPENKRPTRKCSAADKLCFEIDDFMSDEDDFENTFDVAKTRALTKRSGGSTVKEKSKKTVGKSSTPVTTENKGKKEKTAAAGEEKTPDEGQKGQTAGKKVKNDSKSVKSVAADAKTDVDSKKKDGKSDKKPDDTGRKVQADKVQGKRGKSGTADERPLNKSGSGKSQKDSDKSSDGKEVAGVKATTTRKEGAASGKNSTAKNDEKASRSGSGKDKKKGAEAKRKSEPVDEPKKGKADKEAEPAEKTDKSKTQRERDGSSDREEETENSRGSKRTRPVRQCSTREKQWIETDSDFSFYDTSDDDLPIFDINSMNKVNSSLEMDAKENSESVVADKPDVNVPLPPPPPPRPEVVPVVREDGREQRKRGDPSAVETFSESDDEPLKKKALVPETTSPSTRVPAERSDVRSPVRSQREVPGLHPLPGGKKPDIPVMASPPPVPKLLPPVPVPGMNVKPFAPVSVSNDPKPLFFDPKSPVKRPEVPVHGHGLGPQPVPAKDEFSHMRNNFFVNNLPGGPVVSVPNRIEMILHTLKRDKVAEPVSATTSYANDVKVTFGNVPYQPRPSPFNPVPCTYQMKPIVNFPQPREPISTHGLDLLSEVALPTTPKEKLNCQTERIEKWLKDSLEAEQKKSFLGYGHTEYKHPANVPKPGSEKPQPTGAFSKPTNSSSHSEFQKFGQMELLASQKLLKKNLFAPDVKAESSSSSLSSPSSSSATPAPRVEPPPTSVQPKKTLTSVQDLLKLQKERKEMTKSPKNENSPHLKNCKCNNCIVKKAWFKNKPVPRADQQKPLALSSADDSEDSAKPFQSLTKAFSKVAEGSNSKAAASVAPMIMTTTPQPQPSQVPTPTSHSSPGESVGTQSSRDSSDKKGIFQQRKLSFLERMKERERKEAAMKANSNAFSPNNERSVYAFEPEAEHQKGSRGNRDGRSSKSEEDRPKPGEDEHFATTSSGTQVDKTVSKGKASSKSMQSASIAVQVNLDMTQVEAVAEVAPDGKSIEISTQTEVPEEDSDSPMFYIPLQQAAPSGGSPGSSDQQLIQGVALKLGTEGPMGPNQRVVMKAKLVTKPPAAPSMKAVVMPQPKRMFDQKKPPIGTVQPTARKPPEEVKSAETEMESPKDTTETRQVPAETSTVSKGSKGTGGSSAGSKGSTRTKEKSSKEPAGTKDKAEPADDHSPSSSKAKRTSKQKSAETATQPSNSSWLPPAGSTSKLVEAPTFYATEKDFQDPFEFFERIRPAAESFGLCRIVPPSTFKPDCKVSDDMRFTAYNQYIHRMFHRWGPNIREMMAIKKYLATQSISLKQPPWIGGIEVDLPRLYQSVQNCGGLMKVMEKKKWNQVADMMRIPKAAQDRVTKLDDIYCKYLLPYDTLSPDERQKLFDEVERDWAERQRTTEASSASEDDDEDNYIDECEECVVKGRNMALNQFYRIARNTMSMWFKNADPPPKEVENEFWRHVSERNHHVCVHSGSIDSSGWGYGFPIAKNNSFSRHPWNLKVLTNNSGSVLRSLGPVMGVTVPTLHVGMVFTAFCWYRDPHGLPWIEYLHTGAPKIWYGIADDNSAVFQEALAKLLPRYIKNKTIWLPSDTAMIPPALLVEHGVSLCHTVQEPGQFILVFPKAFISSICTGYLVSESVYFARPSWLATAEQAFKDIQESCEPSMFSLEKLLFSIANDSRTSVDVLKQVLPMVWHVRQKELDERKTLFNLGLKTSEKLPSKEFGNKKRKGRWAQDDEGEYECEVCRTNLFVSLVTNSVEEGTYCLQHAIDLLTQKRHQLKYCKLMYTYTQEEMNELVEKLEQRIEAKSQKKPPSKSSTSSGSNK